MLQEIRTSREAISSQFWAIGEFWHSYEGVSSRMRMTTEQMTFGLQMFQYWVDGGEAVEEALLTKEKMEQLCRDGDTYLRREAILRRGRSRI